VRRETGQVVENLWMNGEFPVDGWTREIYFSAASVGNAHGVGCVCAFVTRFA
jgi:hypothetical protein